MSPARGGFINRSKRMDLLRLDVVNKPKLAFFIRIKVRGGVGLNKLVLKQPCDDSFSVQLKEYALRVHLRGVNILPAIFLFLESAKLDAVLVFTLHSGVTIRAGNKRNLVT